MERILQERSQGRSSRNMMMNHRERLHRDRCHVDLYIIARPFKEDAEARRQVRFSLHTEVHHSHMNSIPISSDLIPKARKTTSV